MFNLLALLVSHFFIYFMVGPAWTAGIVASELIVAAAAAYFFVEGRKLQETIDDEGTKRKIQTTFERDRLMALAANGIDGIHHHEATAVRNVEIK